MKKYNCTFHGRAKGAIGIFHPCSDVVEADTPEQARLKLYDKWDHIQFLHMEEVKKEEGRIMKVYILKEKNTTVSGFSRPGAILATYVVNDDIKPGAAIQLKLGELGYELASYSPNTITSVSDFELSVRDEVRIDNDLEPGGEEWPER